VAQEEPKKEESSAPEQAADTDEHKKKGHKEKKPKKVTLSGEEHEALARKAAELDTLKDKLLRGAADYDNAKKRLARDKDEFLKYAFESTILDLLPVLDNFERALSHIDASDAKLKSLRDGFLLIDKQLVSLLTERGLKRIESVGKPFDPHQHEAVGRVETKDGEEGMVIEEALAGYELNGKLLRPSKVKVSAKPKAEPTEEKSEDNKEETEEGIT